MVDDGDDTAGDTRENKDSRMDGDDESTDRERIVDEITDLMEKLHGDERTDEDEETDAS